MNIGMLGRGHPLCNMGHVCGFEKKISIITEANANSSSENALGSAVATCLVARSPRPGMAPRIAQRWRVSDAPFVRAEEAREEFIQNCWGSREKPGELGSRETKSFSLEAGTRLASPFVHWRIQCAAQTPQRQVEGSQEHLSAWAAADGRPGNNISSSSALRVQTAGGRLSWKSYR